MADERPDIVKVTLKDIAARTGFTINTVSWALKNKEVISRDTRKLIQDTAQEMGYISNTLAGALRTGVTKTIAVIVGDISNPHFGIMVKEIENTAGNHGYNTFIINTEENCELEETAVVSAIGKNVDGIILCPAQKNAESIKILKRSGVPFVLIGRYFKEIETDYVVCDDMKGGYLATKYLIDRGHDRIIFLNGSGYISSAMERREGYCRALTEAGIEIDEGLIREVSIKSGDCRRVLKKVTDSGIKFTAVFAFSDMIAWEAIYTLSRMGLRVPEDIAVVGFDNIQSRLFFPFPLTSVCTSKSRMSRRSVDVLLNRINNPGDKVITDVIDTRLVIRSST